MEKKLSCRAMGLNCKFEARGESEEAIVKVMETHVNKIHGITWTEDLRAKAGDLIRLVEAS